jgi:hypothetical protein
LGTSFVLPLIEQHGAIQAWIIDDTGFPQELCWNLDDALIRRRVVLASG